MLNICQKSFFFAKIVTEQVLNDSLMQNHFASVKISAKKKLNMTTSSLEFLEDVTWWLAITKLGGSELGSVKYLNLYF